MQGGYVDGAVGIAAASSDEGTMAGIGARVGTSTGVREDTGVREGTGTEDVEGAGAGVCAGERAATASVGAMVNGSINTSSGAGARLKVFESPGRQPATNRLQWLVPSGVTQVHDHPPFSV